MWNCESKRRCHKALWPLFGVIVLIGSWRFVSGHDAKQDAIELRSEILSERSAVRPSLRAKSLLDQPNGFQGKVSESAPTPAFSKQLKEYLAPNNQMVLLESHVLSMLERSDLPQLYLALEDDKFAPSWSSILLAICVLEDDTKALSVLKHFVSTPWDWKASTYGPHESSRIIRNRIKSVTCVALLVPELSGPFLQSIFTHEGTVEFLSAWQSLEFPHEEMTFAGTLVSDFRYSAASGLLHTRSAELFTTVESEFRRIAALPKLSRTSEERELLVNCQLIFAERDLYLEMGWEEGVAYLYSLDGERKLDAILSRIGSYAVK